MELKAKKDFTDRITGKKYKENDKIKVDKATGDRLLKSPYDVVEIRKESEKDVQAKTD